MNSRHSLLPAVAATALLLAILIFNGWLILYRQPVPAALLVALVVETLLLGGLLWVVYALLHTRLYRPLRMMEDQLKVLTYTDADHQLPLPDPHYLGTLPATAENLAHALLRERDQTARAIDAATTLIEQRKTRLEAILHDLSEGIIVCSAEHKIILFNQAAGLFLSEAGTLSLHRETRDYFNAGPIESNFDRLLHRYQIDSEREVAEMECQVAGRQIKVRMNLIIESDSRCNGYVLSLSGDVRLGQRNFLSSQSILTDRPEFYDFSLFDRNNSVAQLDTPLDELSYVVFDTETTGLWPSRGDEIVQLSGVRIVDGHILDSTRFDELVNPGISIPPSSIRFHGITDNMVVNSPAVEEVLQRFYTFSADAILVAHNAAFDMKFLTLKESRSGIVFDQPVLDTLLLSFVLHASHSAHTLDAIAVRFGIEISPEARHTALGDALSTAQIFLRMLDALPGHGIKTLRQAMDSSNQVFEIRKMQERF
jgi:DNA polymerase III epsilon subunit family exonuclease